MSTLTEGGPVSHLLNLAPSVAGSGAHVRLLCGNPEVAARARNLELEADVAPLRNKADIARAVQMWPRLRGADVVHTQDRRALLLCGAAARAFGARLVHTYHGLPEELVGLPGQRGARPVGSPLRSAWLLHGHLRVEALLARLGALVVPSRALANFLAAHGFPRGRIHVLPSRIDIRRREPGPGHRPIRLVTIARLERHKGIDILLAACAQLTRQAQPVHLDVYGDGSLRADLERCARMLRLDVSFHGNVSAARDYLLEADVFVLPSRGENLPITILEAMAIALPVVATRVGGISELVQNGATGILVEPDDVEALANALGRLVDDASLRATMGRSGVCRIAERFDASEAGTEMLDLYERLCGSSM